MLTVGEIRKAIKNLPDDAEVRLNVATADGVPQEIEDALSDVVLERAFRDVLHGHLVIDGQIND